MELIGMSDKVLYESEKLYDDNGFLNDRLKNIINYANFLKMKLELWMFIPCDKDGNVLEDKGECSCSGNPEYCHGCNSYYYHSDKFKESDIYQEAKDRIIFDGLHIHIDKDGYDIDDKNGTLFFVDNKNTMGWIIEDLIEFFNLTITPKAIKKYNLT